LIVVGMCVSISSAEASRFWVANTKSISSDIVKEQLLQLPQSLKHLGNEFADGWSISFYKGTTALVARSEKSSSQDEKFDQAVDYAAKTQANIVIGHLRQASSGCNGDTPDPYPFQLFHNGRNWLFGHNGGIDKQLLMSLIGEEYLKQNSPQICVSNPPDSWIDSELYFIYLVKKIDEADSNVRKGLMNAVEELLAHTKDKPQSLNFFLADGKEVWAFRKGNSLYYTYDKENRLSIISSIVPGEGRFEWKEFPEDNLALLSSRKKPKFYSLVKK